MTATAPARPSSDTAPAPLWTGPALERAAFAAVRRTMALAHCKWDPQIGDAGTLAPFPLWIARDAWGELRRLAERLAAETCAVETELLARPELRARLALPRRLRATLAGATAATLAPAAARVMRFDFHWTDVGWRVSEVNSDVPGGYAEAAEFAVLMARHCSGGVVPGDPAAALTDALARVAGARGRVVLLSAPGYTEDFQVVAYLAARLRARGLDACLGTPSHLRWVGGRAHLATAWGTGPVDAVVRFYQAEWLAELPRRAGWECLFVRGHTPVANPGVAVLSESKRLALTWDALRTSTATWRALLPATRDPREVPWARDERWVLKAAYSNTGDAVGIRGVTATRDWVRLAWRVGLMPGAWVAQERFATVALESPWGRVYPCIGVYTVDGVAAGIYARIARGPVINGAAADVAVLVATEACA